MSLTAGQPSSFKHRHHIRVAYVDTDQAGVVHHSTYVRYLEAARIEYLRAVGVEYKAFEELQKLALPVVHVDIRYRRPAFFDDQLCVDTWVGKISKASLKFDSSIYRGDQLLTQAAITLACVDKAGRARAMPVSIWNACAVQK